MENNQSQNKQTQSSRRSFLQKAGAGVVLASLPARTVWATGNQNASVMGSMSGSGAMDSAKICLRSHGYFKTHHSEYSASKNKFKDCFGGRALHKDGTEIRLVTEDDYKVRGEYHPELSEVVQCEGDGANGVALELDDGRVITEQWVNPTYTGTNASCKKRHYSRHKKQDDWSDHDEVGTFNLSGPSNLNAQMTCIYLNAAYHGESGIWYPVLRQFGGSFDSLEQFGQHLYQMALANPFGLGPQLDQLIQTHHV
mgnify:CR=1 FL=1